MAKRPAPPTARRVVKLADLAPAADVRGGASRRVFGAEAQKPPQPADPPAAPGARKSRPRR